LVFATFQEHGLVISITVESRHMRGASMRTIIASIAALLFALPLMSHAQAPRAALEDAAAALGASGLTPLQLPATRAMFATRHTAVPGQRRPQFSLQSY